MNLWDKIKNKITPVEENAINLPMGNDSSDIGDVFREVLSQKNIFQTAMFSNEQAFIISIMRAYRNNPDNLSLFLMDIYLNLTETSVSVDGIRNEMLTNISVGQLSQNFQMKLARERANAMNGNNQLDGVI